MIRTCSSSHLSSRRVRAADGGGRFDRPLDWRICIVELDLQADDGVAHDRQFQGNSSSSPLRLLSAACTRCIPNESDTVAERLEGYNLAIRHSGRTGALPAAAGIRWSASEERNN